MMKSFLKYAGSKQQVLDVLMNNLPPMHKIKEYHEPFLGGGSMLLAMIQKFPALQYVVGDINRDLMIAWKAVRENPKQLIEKLDEYQQKYWEKPENFFYKIRSSYNESRYEHGEWKLRFYKAEYTERAAQFIFLNKACFNGLLRYNSSGEFNVSWCKSKSRSIYDAENIQLISKLLNKVDISFHCRDYTHNLKSCTDSTLVFIDPPYLPISKTSSHTAYTKDSGWDSRSEFKRLATHIKNLDNAGSWVMHTSSDLKNTNPDDNFFDDLFSDFYVDRYPAKRSISCKGDGRREISELLVTNYPKIVWLSDDGRCALKSSEKPPLYAFGKKIKVERLGGISVMNKVLTDGVNLREIPLSDVDRSKAEWVI